jgi:carbon-monoxide dehydrogenase medium subunit
MSLIPIMKLRLASPAHLIDINPIRELSYIRKEDGAVSIGALVRHNEILESDLIKKNLPILADAAEVIGDEQVRNMGTIGGSLAHADPAADYAGVVLALDAVIMVQGPKGVKPVAAKDFFVDTFTPAIEPNELVVGLKLPVSQHASGAYLKLERRAGDFATVGVGTHIGLDEKGTCVKAGVGLVSMGPKPLKAQKAESFLVGKRKLDGSAIKQAADLASEEAQPFEDLRGSEEYKREMVRVFTERALGKTLGRIQERLGELR